MRRIGRLNETELHEQLKHVYAGSEGRPESEVDGFIVDVAHPDEVIEIQTGGFGRLRRKIVALAPNHRIRIVHPIAIETVITKLAETGELLSSRRSPKRGRAEELFRELTSIADLLPNPAVVLEVVLVRAVETRIADGNGSWRRRGVSIVARRLGEIVETRRLATGTDYVRMLPAGLPSQFANSDIMEASGLRYRLVQPITSSLRKMGLIRFADRRGREQLYELV
jgi:hypothetical protein